ncbi:hypothetical protein DFH09DRAFT_1102901 [Mycena vulgaris]|nr:hypothetical protein DFH09DRAFT_1102901 [Mycena vulgaris]
MGLVAWFDVRIKKKLRSSTYFDSFCHVELAWHARSTPKNPGRRFGSARRNGQDNAVCADLQLLRSGHAEINGLTTFATIAFDGHAQAAGRPPAAECRAQQL